MQLIQMMNDIKLKEYLKRRKQLLSQLDTESAVIVPAGTEKTRNGDICYPFRAASDFMYLAGFSEPGALLVFVKTDNAEQTIMFVQQRDPVREQWLGPGLGPEGAYEFGADQAYPLEELDERMPQLLAGCRRLYYDFALEFDWHQRLHHWLTKLAPKRSKTNVISQLVDLRPVLSAMRLIKSQTELNCIREAVRISEKAHTRAMQHCKAGMGEFELAAELTHEFMRHGCLHTAYNTIVGSGDNACVLHYEHCDDYCADGELVLIDAGVEYQGYAADITRTFPANGRFSSRQRAVYEIVLDAQTRLIDYIQPGVSWESLGLIASRRLTEGLVELGLLQGDVDGLIEQGAHRRFYPHSFGHWLGLDVHDVGDYRPNGQWRELAPRMVFTVEPGLYIKGTDTDFDGIGVRIEDNVAVTDSGYEVLSQGVVKSPDDIENLMG